MREKRKELYHCARCGELFRAPVVSADKVICNLCGHSPRKAIQTKLDLADMTKGDAQMAAQKQVDHADFVGRTRSKRSKQMKIAAVAWIVLLCVGGGASVYYKTKQEDLATKRAKQKKVGDYEKLLFLKRQQIAVQQAEAVINRFILTPDVNTRSQYVIDGMQLLLEMEHYYDTRPSIVVEGALRIARVRLVEDQEFPILETMLIDRGGKKMEVVFEERDNRWKIDWTHFVRYSGKSWNRFLLEKREGSVGQFRLYVRKRASGSGDNKDNLNLIFYEPKIFDGKRGVESPEVELNRHTEAGKKIFTELESVEKERSAEKVLGSFDTPGIGRVNVELGWVMERDEPKLVVLKVLATDWMTHKN